MIRRLFADEADKVNELLNDQAIRPTLLGEGYLDATGLLKDENNRCYMDERGGSMFRWAGPGIYEGHSFFRVRGREALEAGRECLFQMSDARIIWGATPLQNRAARWFNRQLGFKSQGEISIPLQGRCELFSLEK
jgi:hypothetical protein